MRTRCISILSLAAAVCTAALVGCGGSGPGGGGEHTLQFGSLTTRIAGTVQPPVTSGEAGVVVTGVAGGNISSMTLQDTSPTLAESRIAFMSTRDGNYEVYAMNADASGQTRLTNNAAFDYKSAWSPDGSKIAFTSSRDAGNFEIYAMNADGSGQTRLTTNAAIDYGPAWSPDGSKIAFASNRDGNYEVYSMNADGSGQTRLTNNAAPDYAPAWSPDGSRITFESGRDGTQEVYAMNADGSGQTRLTNNAANDYAPAWSPDGSKIAFTSSRDAGNYEVYAMNADGSGQTRLTNNAATDHYPSWSPDGSKIAFVSIRDGNDEIYAMNADGSGQDRLTNNAEDDSFPEWGPLIKRRTIIGAGGSMGTNASGFLFGQADEQVRSLVVFDAVTRTSARVKAQTGLGDGLPNVVFSVSGDSINRLSYMNFTDALPKVVTVVGPGTSIPTATDAIVSIGASRGVVASVIPYTSNRSAAPAISVETGVRVLRGSFLGAWDGKGVNRAPNGASEVRLDSRTGEIVGVR